MRKFFSDELTFDVMLQRIKEMIAKTPTWIGQIIKFACIIGLRPSEVLESVRLINNISRNTRINPSSSYYYNPQRQALEHFRFPEIFIRQTKKAYLSFVTPEMLDIVHQVNNVPSIGAITKACHRRHTRMDMHLTRKIFASHLRNEGIQPEIIDMLQGRVSQSILTRHYLVPKPSFKEDIIKALEKLQRQL
jgi:intergrase/recombinase